MRLFVEAVLDDEALEAAWSAGQALRAEPQTPSHSIRWVRREAFHLTLRFLGEVDESSTSEIASALAELSNLGPMPLQIGELGTFGGRFPRVVWLGLADDAGLLPRLRERLDAALAETDLEPDPAPFRPHLTLGRVRRQATRDELAALRRAIANRPPLQVSTTVRAVALVESTLTPGSPRYRQLARVEL